MKIKIADIVLDGNVRADTGDVSALAQSIKTQGLLQYPLVVAIPDRPGKYELIAGFRRLAAMKLNEMTEINVIEQEPFIDTASRIAAQVAENLQRENLTDWDLAQAAMDLKLEGLNQGEVSSQLLIPKSEVSRMQRAAKALLADEDVNTTQLSVFTLDGLEKIAETEAAPSDILALLKDGDGGQYEFNRALSAAKREARIATFLGTIDEDLQDWSQTGIEITYENVLFKQASNGNTIKDNNVAVVGDGRDELDVPIEDHISLDCHTIWINIPEEYQYGDPKVLHLCTKVKSHYKAEADMPAADAADVAKEKVSNSAERAKSRQDKLDRASIARQFVESKTEVKVLRHLAITRALESVHYNSWGVFVRVLGLSKPTGEHAENTVRLWLEQQRDPDAALLKLILIETYYEQGAARTGAAKWVQEEVLPGFEAEVTDEES